MIRIERMAMVPLFEYYDGYEADGPMVRYFVIGEGGQSEGVGICYTEELNLIAWIGKGTHSRAWRAGEITEEQARKCLKNSYERRGKSLEECKRKLVEVLRDAAALDAKELATLKPGCSSSVSDGTWGISYSWGHGRLSYVAAFAQALEKKIKLLEMREAWLGNG